MEALFADSRRIFREAIAEHFQTHREVARVILFSGGDDSTVLAHMLRHSATHAAHINTGIGIEQTRQFVRDTCAQWRLPLLEGWGAERAYQQMPGQLELFESGALCSSCDYRFQGGAA